MVETIVIKWFGFLAAASAAAAACFAPTAPEAAPARTNQQATNLSKLWDQTCAKCHGDRGQGGGGGTQTLLTRALFDQEHDRRFFDVIKSGSPEGGMDAYGATLSDAEIWGLVVHVRELQARALREKDGSPRPVDGVYRGQRHNFRLETVLDQGLETPWSVDWLPGGKLLVTNRPGSMVVVENGKIASKVEGLPAVLELGQGGLMDVAVHPDYAKNSWIYLGFTDPAKEGRGGFTKVVRGKLDVTANPAKWLGTQMIFEMPQDVYNGSGVHFGCRIVFDGKGHVFFSVGERGAGERAQDLTRPNGKIYRLNEDGSVPSDNPFASAEDREKGHLASVWSYGHRNPQGLVFGLDGVLWDTEHGPRGGDELNRIDRGANYGWPLYAFSINYNDSPLSTPWPPAEAKIQLPVFRWLPSIGASGLDVVRGAAFPSWKGDLVAGGLSGANLDRIRVSDGKVVEREELLHGLGRVRDVAVAPDGTIYLALNGPDHLVRLVPAP